MVHWESYAYTKPIAQALEAEFGTAFGLANTGGGCICLEAYLEGGLSVLVGCAVDGPLLHDAERQEYAHGGGYGVGVYDESAPWSGRTLANATDYRAETGEDVIELVRRALRLVSRSTPETYINWTRNLAGEIQETEYRN